MRESPLTLGAPGLPSLAYSVTLFLLSLVKEETCLLRNSRLMLREQMNRETNYMMEAIKEAEAGVMLKHGGPFGAVVVRNGEIIGRGHNMVVGSNDPTAHGEVVAIRDACNKIGNFDLSEADLYTTCYPCPMCLGAILWSRIQKVYYCANSEDAARIGFDDSVFYKKLEDLEYIKDLFVFDKDNAQFCSELFDKYKNDPNKKLY